MAQVVRESYLGEDVVAEAARYGASEEFRATCRLLGADRLPASARILDLGAGNGIAAAAFARLGHEVVALDPDESATVGLRAVRAMSASLRLGCLRCCCGFAQRLPFRDGSFDVVYARQTLHHVTDLTAGLRECQRVLKPDGRLLAVREHVADDEEQLRAFLEHHPLHRLYGGEHAYRLDEYLEAGRMSGLVLTQMLGPFDTVINYYPKSDTEVRAAAVGYLSRKTGRYLAEAALRVPAVFAWYVRRMSGFDQTPGRLYSFLWVKPRSAP